jgi:hypothetical protein
MAVLVDLRKLLSFRGGIVPEVEEIISSTTLVLLACIEMVDFGLQGVLDQCIHALHLLKPSDFPLKPLFTLLCIIVLDLFKFLLSYLLVSDGKVLVESFLLYCATNEVSYEQFAYLRCNAWKSDLGCAPGLSQRTCDSHPSAL